MFKLQESVIALFRTLVKMTPEVCALCLREILLVA